MVRFVFTGRHMYTGNDLISFYYRSQGLVDSSQHQVDKGPGLKVRRPKSTNLPGHCLHGLQGGPGSYGGEKELSSWEPIFPELFPSFWRTTPSSVFSSSSGTEVSIQLI